MVVRAAVERQDTKSTADLRLAKCGRFVVCQRAEFTGAALNDISRDVICKAGSFGAGTRGVRKDVEVGKGAIFDEAQRGGVVFFGFTWEPGEDIGANGGVGQALANQFDAASVMLGAIPAMHGGEDAIGGGLQRHMEVWSDTTGRGK